MDYYDIIIEKLLFIAIVMNTIVLCCKIYEIFMAIKKSSSSTSEIEKTEKTEMSNVDNDLKKYFRY